MIAWLLTVLITAQASPDAARFVAEGENPYFILKAGYQLTLKGTESGKRLELVVRVLDETRVIDGVTTRVVEERESENGQLIEVSRNFFAFDPASRSIYYFGEDVDIYKHGTIVDHEGSWQAGQHGARFGLMMPGSPSVGLNHYQEQAPGIAMDHAEIVSLSYVQSTPAGRFERCLRTRETTPLEKGAVEYKVYAPGVGLVKDGNLLLTASGYKR